MGVLLNFPHPDSNSGDPWHWFPASSRPYSCPSRWQNLRNGILPGTSETEQGLCRIPSKLCIWWKHRRGWTDKYSTAFSLSTRLQILSLQKSECRECTLYLCVKCPLLLNDIFAFVPTFFADTENIYCQFYIIDKCLTKDVQFKIDSSSHQMGRKKRMWCLHAIAVVSDMRLHLRLHPRIMPRECCVCECG